MQKNKEINRECPTVNLPEEDIIRKQLQLLPDTDLQTAKLHNQKLIKEVALKNIKEQIRFGLISDTSNLGHCYLMTHKFKELETSNSDSVYSVYLSSYKIIKLKSSYLIVNYFQTGLSFICYQPQNDSLIIQYLGALDSFIGSKEIKTDSISYFTFAFSSSTMGLEHQNLCIIAYSNYSDEYKFIKKIINEKSYGTGRECDSLFGHKVSIDYELGLMKTDDSLINLLY